MPNISQRSKLEHSDLESDSKPLIFWGSIKITSRKLFGDLKLCGAEGNYLKMGQN